MLNTPLPFTPHTLRSTCASDHQRPSGLAEPGDTIYQAAKKAGIAIPSLCASDHLNPFGSCRLCLCEIEGQSGTAATCTTPAREGLVVQTETKRLQRLRRNIVELYLSEQPAAGPVPEALQRLAVSSGVRSVRYHNPARRLAYRDDSNPFFSFDNAACISCARCVRACDEIQGTFALTMIGRGFEARPAAESWPKLRRMHGWGGACWRSPTRWTA